jgi:hypothetical protein
MKCEFSKKLLIVDYLVLIVLFVCQIIFPAVDFTTIIVAWVAQLGISSTAYYWKTKSDNRVKVPLKVIESLPEDIREQIDLTQVVISIIQSD